MTHPFLIEKSCPHISYMSPSFSSTAMSFKCRLTQSVQNFETRFVITLSPNSGRLCFHSLLQEFVLLLLSFSETIRIHLSHLHFFMCPKYLKTLKNTFHKNYSIIKLTLIETMNFMKCSTFQIKFERCS